MALSATWSNIVLGITAVVLFYAAVTDLREFKIRNNLILLLTVLFIVHAILSGRWRDAHWNLALAAFMFFVLLIFYSRNWIGGGDVKILTVGFLWVGLDCAMFFALVLMGCAIVHVIAVALGWLKYQESGGRRRIAFAPSVAVALIIVFASGCLAPNEFVIKLSGSSPAATVGTA